MSDQIKMNYPQVEEMIAALKKVASQLRDTQTALDGIAKTIDGGALLGSAGETFSTGIRSQLHSAIDRLAQKLEERATFVANEEAKLKAAIGDSANQY